MRENWCDENSNNIECDIDQCRHKINNVYIVIDDAYEFVHKTIKANLIISILSIIWRLCTPFYFHCI